MSDFEDSKPVVIDSGSSLCKVGFGGSEAPLSVFPTVVGRPRYTSMIMMGEREQLYVGQMAQDKRGILTISYPVQHGVVSDWDDMEKIWDHSFRNVLRVAPEDHRVLLTEVPLNTRPNREKMAEIMFETFKTPAMCSYNSAVLSLLASGRTTGLVLESGDGVTIAVPVVDGLELGHAIQTHNVAGSDITDVLMKRLNNGYDHEAVRVIKEKLVHVSKDYDKDLIRADLVYDFPSYEPPCYDDRPNGLYVELEEEDSFVCAEVLFKPHLANKSPPGIHEMIHESIMDCENRSMKKNMYSNIVLSGGSTLFPGIVERLTKEISELASNDMNIYIKVEQAHERKYGAWLGGSILSMRNSFEKEWILKKEYDEYGSSIVHRWRK